MYIEQISTIHSEVPLLNISNIFKRYISIKNSNQQTSKRITLLRLKKTGEVYVYIYIYIILIKIYIYIFILLKIYKYTYTRWYTRTGTHTYIYISYHKVSTCCDSDRQTDTHAHATNSLNSLYCSGGRSPMLARPRRSRTVKSSSRGHAQIHFQWMSTESVRECLCVCVCLYVYRSRSNIYVRNIVYVYIYI